MTEARTDPDLLYVGTYADAFYVVAMDRRSGELMLFDSVEAGQKPSFLALHPNRRVLYAVNELDKGAVRAFAIAERTRAVTPLNEQPSEGGAPCYVSVDRRGGALLVANYAGGNVALLPIEANGALAPATSVVPHTGTGPNAERQEAPHAHCIIPDPSNRFALAADLGADRIFVYRLETGGKLLHVSEAVMRPGAGPRHLTFHPTLPLVFVANELDSTVATLRFDADRGALSPVDTHSTVATLPPGWTGTNYPADIHVDSKGRTLYVSNRGHNSIAVFSVTKEGALALEQTISTEGDWPRNFSLDPSGRWLLVANQRSDSVVVFGRDPANGRLTPTKQKVQVPSPVCLRFLAEH
jgi:6-phosphogluconolactonase